MELPAKGIVIHKHPFHRQSSEGDKSQGSQIRHIRQDLVLKYINEKGYVLCIEKRPLKLKLDVNYPTNWRMLVFIFKNCSKFHNKNDYWHFANVCDIWDDPEMWTYFYNHFRHFRRRSLWRHRRGTKMEHIWHRPNIWIHRNCKSLQKLNLFSLKKKCFL